MHIVEGILSPPVIVVGTLCAAAGVGIGLKKMDANDVPRVGVLTAAFFVASLVHVSFGVASAHFILNGLLGILLGWAAFPAIFIGLTLQTLFFGFGGISVLGVNTLTMALPAVGCYYIFRPYIQLDVTKKQRALSGGALTGMLAGIFAVAGAAILFSLVLLSGGPEFMTAAGAILVAHLPIMVMEGIATGTILSYLLRVRPEVFNLTALPEASNA